MGRSVFFALGMLAGAASSAYATTWSTTSHMGYAVNRQSSTGFERIGGTMAYLDATRELGASLDLGLRTLAQGSRAADLEFYRLGSGPVLGWLPAAGWRLEVSVAFFRESGLAPDGTKVYRSQGRAVSFGWERRQSLGPRVSWAYGSFVLAHRGELDLISGFMTASLRAPLAAQRNDGFSQGAQVALRIQLD